MLQLRGAIRVRFNLSVRVRVRARVKISVMKMVLFRVTIGDRVRDRDSVRG